MLSRTSRASSTKISRSSLSAAAWLDGSGAVGAGASAARGGASSCFELDGVFAHRRILQLRQQLQRARRLGLQLFAVEQVGFVGQHRQQPVEFADRTRVASDIDQALGLLMSSLQRLAGCGLDVVGAPRLRHAQVDRARRRVEVVVGRSEHALVGRQGAEFGSEYAGGRVVVEHAARPLGVLPEAFHKEADRPEVLRDAAELVGLGRDLRVRKPRDRCLDVAQCRDRILIAQQREHAADLIEHRRGRGQIGSLERIAEEVVEALLDFPQRGLRFRDDGAHRQAVLGASCDFRHPRPGVGQRLALPRLQQPLDDLLRALLVLVVGLRQIVDAEVGEQQRRCDLEAEAFAQIPRQLGSNTLRDLADHLDRRADRARRKTAGRGAGERDLLIELRGLVGTGDDLAPELLGLGQRFLQRAQRIGIDGGQRGPLEVGGYQRIEPEQALDLADARRAAMRAPDVVERSRSSGARRRHLRPRSCGAAAG